LTSERGSRSQRRETFARVVAKLGFNPLASCRARVHPYLHIAPIQRCRMPKACPKVVLANDPKHPSPRPFPALPRSSASKPLPHVPSPSTPERGSRSQRRETFARVVAKLGFNPLASCRARVHAPTCTLHRFRGAACLKHVPTFALANDPRISSQVAFPALPRSSASKPLSVLPLTPERGSRSQRRETFARVVAKLGFKFTCLKRGGK